jgi:hypothetical protein
MNEATEATPNTEVIVRDAEMPPPPALKHGVYSMAVIEPRTHEIMESIIADKDVTWVQAADHVLLAAYARLAAIDEAYGVYHARVGVVDDKGRTRPSVRDAGLNADRLRRIADRLCLSPAQRIELEVAGAAAMNNTITLKWDIAAIDRLLDDAGLGAER